MSALWHAPCSRARQTLTQGYRLGKAVGSKNVVVHDVHRYAKRRCAVIMHTAKVDETVFYTRPRPCCGPPCTPARGQQSIRFAICRRKLSGPTVSWPATSTRAPAQPAFAYKSHCPTATPSRPVIVAIRFPRDKHSEYGRVLIPERPLVHVHRVHRKTWRLPWPTVGSGSGCIPPPRSRASALRCHTSRGADERHD